MFKVLFHFELLGGARVQLALSASRHISLSSFDLLNTDEENAHTGQTLKHTHAYLHRAHPKVFTNYHLQRITMLTHKYKHTHQLLQIHPKKRFKANKLWHVKLKFACPHTHTVFHTTSNTHTHMDEHTHLYTYIHTHIHTLTYPYTHKLVKSQMLKTAAL